MRVLTSTGMVTKQKDLLRFNFGQKSVYEDFEAILLSGSIEVDNPLLQAKPEC